MEMEEVFPAKEIDRITRGGSVLAIETRSSASLVA